MKKIKTLLTILAVGVLLVSCDSPNKKVRVKPIGTSIVDVMKVDTIFRVGDTVSYGAERECIIVE